MDEEEEDSGLAARGPAPARPRGKTGVLGVYGMIALGIAGVIYIAGVVQLYYEPAEFEGMARIQFTLEHLEDPQRADYEAAFATLGSRVVLDRTVEDLDLATMWDMTPEETARVLQEKIELEPEADYRVARISCYHTNANVAAQIANAVADAYSAFVSLGFEEFEVTRLDKLSRLIAEQKDAFEDSRVKMLESFKESGGFSLDGGDIKVGSSGTLDPREITDAAQYEDYLRRLREYVESDEAQADYHLNRDLLKGMQRELVERRIAVARLRRPAIRLAYATPQQEPSRPDIDARLESLARTAIIGGLVGAVLIATYRRLRRRSAA